MIFVGWSAGGGETQPCRWRLTQPTIRPYQMELAGAQIEAQSAKEN